MTVYFKKIPEICYGCKSQDVEICLPISMTKELCPCSNCLLKTSCRSACELYHKYIDHFTFIAQRVYEIITPSPCHNFGVDLLKGKEDYIPKRSATDLNLVIDRKINHPLFTVYTYMVKTF